LKSENGWDGRRLIAFFGFDEFERFFCLTIYSQALMRMTIPLSPRSKLHIKKDMPSRLMVISSGFHHAQQRFLGLSLAQAIGTPYDPRDT
jgi:hypothetical protein